MSQSTDGIAVYLLPEHERQNVRLLELPPELADFVKSPNSTLQFKSKAVSQQSGLPTSSTAPSHVVLCTADRTYQLRQVSTSNSILITRPHNPSSSSQRNEDGELRHFTGAVQAFASCSSTLELLSQPSIAGTDTSLRLAEAAWREIVPASSTSAVGLTSSKSGSRNDFLAANKRSAHIAAVRAKLSADIPLSEAECAQGWRQLCIWLDSDDRPSIPTPSTLVSAWSSLKNLLDSRTGYVERLEKESFTSQMLDDEMRSWDEVLEEVPVGLLDAILVRVGKYHYDDKQEGEKVRWSLDRPACVRWTGEILLQKAAAESTVSAMLLETFLQQWETLLPASWTGEAQLEKLEGLYAQPTPEKIKCISAGGSKVTAEGDKGTGSGGGASGASQAATAGRRKWHEKFAASRKR